MYQSVYPPILSTDSDGYHINSLQDALSYYSGQYGNGIFWYGGCILNYRPTLMTLPTSISPIYEYVDQDYGEKAYEQFSDDLYCYNQAIKTEKATSLYYHLSKREIELPNLSKITTSITNTTSWGSKIAKSKLRYLYVDNLISIPNYWFLLSKVGRTKSVLKQVHADSCLQIGVAAFQNQIALERVWAHSCQVLHKKAFIGCSMLQTINLPNCLYWQSSIFWNCTRLQSIYITSPYIKISKAPLKQLTSQSVDVYVHNSANWSSIPKNIRLLTYSTNITTQEVTT